MKVMPTFYIIIKEELGFRPFYFVWS